MFSELEQDQIEESIIKLSKFVQKDMKKKVLNEKMKLFEDRSIDEQI